VNFDIYIVTSSKVSELHQSSVEDESLRITDFGDRFEHRVKLCITIYDVKNGFKIDFGFHHKSREKSETLGKLLVTKCR
jgi:hypothetical protein